MTVKGIRSVDELEDLRVTLSELLEEKRKSSKSRDDLLEVKQLRTELNDVVDELVAAKNIAVDVDKANKLQQIKDEEKEQHKHYKEYIKFLAEIVPALETLSETLPKANWLASHLQNNRTRIERLTKNYNNEYGEYVEVNPKGCRGIPDYNIQNLLEWTSSDFNQAIEKAKGKPAAGE